MILLTAWVLTLALLLILFLVRQHPPCKWHEWEGTLKGHRCRVCGQWAGL